jgi:hypothetical protein
LMHCSRGLKKMFWKHLCGCSQFFSKHKAPNYRTRVENLLATFRIMGCNMSLKLRFFHSHRDFFEATFEMFLTSWWVISPIHLHYRKMLTRPAMLAN